MLWRAMHCHYNPDVLVKAIDKHVTERHDHVSHLVEIGTLNLGNVDCLTSWVLPMSFTILIM